MRIALISTPFVAVPPRDYGGTELMVYELAEGLVRRGHDVTVYATGNSTTSSQLRWLYGTAQWPPDPLTDLNHVSWALGDCIGRGFDVVHAQSAMALSCPRLAALPPLVYTLHHPRDESLSSYYRYFPDVQFVAISADQMRREVQMRHMEVIHHGVDPELYECADQSGDYVAFVGRLARVKGPHTAIDAAAKAGVPIRVAGEIHAVDGPFGEAEVRPRLQAPHVTYLGVIGPEEKRRLLRDARALLAPIEWNEPFGLILIEAMLSGCPVVAFPRGSVPELVEPGLTGFIVHSPEELVATIRPGGPVDEFNRLACRQRAVERFGREHMVSAYEQLYGRVLARAHPAPAEPGLRAATASGEKAAPLPPATPLPRQPAADQNRGSESWDLWA
jgi:glycosyltransferase involved in cell wall biosynthesis